MDLVRNVHFKHESCQDLSRNPRKMYCLARFSQGKYFLDQSEVICFFFWLSKNNSHYKIFFSLKTEDNKEVNLTFFRSSLLVSLPRSCQMAKFGRVFISALPFCLSCLSGPMCSGSSSHSFSSPSPRESAKMYGMTN